MHSQHLEFVKGTTWPCYITGDLRVIQNAKQRELVAKGPKYREPIRVNWKATEITFLESINLHAKD